MRKPEESPAIAAGLIKQGKIVIAPTDTVYGIFADATNKEAVKRVYELKERKLTKPSPIALSSLKEIDRWAIVKNHKLLKKLSKEESLPGLTLVLPLKRKLPKQLTGEKEKIGIRVPQNRLTRKLLKLVEKPLTATSANRAGQPATADYRKLDFRLLQRADLVLGGETKFGKPSTIIDLEMKKILRKGARAGEVEKIIKLYR